MSKELAKEWLKSAFADLRNIEHIIHDDFLTHVVAFHSQQCVEKAFKAFLELKSKKLPRKHSTLRLYGMIKTEMAFEFDSELLVDMDDLYIESRYPSDLGLLPNGKPTLDEAKEFYVFAKNVYDRIYELVDSES